LTGAAGAGLDSKGTHFTHRLIALIAMLFVRLIYSTCRITWLRDDGEEQWLRTDSSCLYSTWHNNVLTGVWFARNRKFGMLVSGSGDGAMLAAVISYFGNCPIRGSSSRGGAKGLRAVLRFLRHDSVVFTPDGPRGPLHRVQPGVIVAAQLSGLPIVPIHFEANRQWVFSKSWDRQKIAKPFSTIFVGIAEPLVIPTRTDTTSLKEQQNQLQEVMLELARKTRAAADSATA